MQGQAHHFSANSLEQLDLLPGKACMYSWNLLQNDCEIREEKTQDDFLRMKRIIFTGIKQYVGQNKRNLKLNTGNITRQVSYAAVIYTVRDSPWPK